ncbi:cilia- and flagella-associated protein 99 [Eucyclogobius newberryi]|uniref:cilia- and flagella-associated protein 99 n=1 Tax=Eucyclogobius newberryi TaxID=166745 RepID=UPI003B58C2C3
MCVNYEPLVRDAIRLLHEFSASRQCPDDFVEDISKDLQSLDPQHKSFILHTVSGCIEQKQLLDVVVNLFYRSAESVPKSDLTMYLVVCYLTTRFLDQLGLKCFGSILKSLGVNKVQKFLLFFLSNLTTVVQEKWMGIYDAEHVQKQWIEPTLRWRPEIIAVLEQLSVKASCGSQLRKAPAKTTEPQEFALTRPKPRAVIVPEIIPELEKQRPVPRTAYKAPKEMQIIADVKQKQQQKTERQLYKANHDKPLESHKSKHYENVVFKIEESIQSKLRFNSFQSTQLPSTTKQSNWHIRLNSAAILRQGALVDRQLKQEFQRMESLVEGAQEPSAFLQWQNEMREKDLQEQLAKVECRRLEGRISHEEAAMARSRLMAQNHAAAQVKKEEAAELMRRYAVKRLQEEKEMRELVQQVSDGHKNARAATEKLHALKKKIVREVSKESQEHLRRALAEAQAEIIRKCEIIRQIHAIESTSSTRSCSFDDKETGGHELLVEMSLRELRERLALLKEAQLVQRLQRQQNIHQQRHRRKQMLQHKLDTIHLHNKALRQTTASRKEQTKQQPGCPQMVRVDESVLALQKRLEEKKQERNSLRHRDSSCRGPSHTGGSLRSRSCEQRDREQRDWGELEQTLAHQIQKLSLM